MSKTILLIEDDRTLFGEVARLLAAHGYAVADGKNGDATDGEYDLALLDVKLPGGAGTRCARPYARGGRTFPSCS